MPWKLFLDDERWPTTNDWVIARSSAEAIALVEARGCPETIAFDHDLGGDDTAMRFARWLADALVDGKLVLPTAFSFSVHSQNPVGVANLTGLMNGLLTHLER